MDIVELDYETFSTEDIKKVGAFKYAEHAEILIAAVSVNGREPVAWVPYPMESFDFPGVDNDKALSIMSLWENPSTLVYAHNSQFELAISDQCLERDIGIKPPEVKQWRCTKAMARKASIEDSLEKCGRFLNLPTQKDKGGLRLIHKFSSPQNDGSRIYPEDEPEEFEKFIAYCLTDVKVEMLIHERLERFELKGFPLEAFQLDIEMNKLGIPVNIDGLENAARILAEYEEETSREFRRLLGFNHTQTERVLEALQGIYGYPHDNLQAKTIEQAIEELEQLSVDPFTHNPKELEELKRILYLKQCLSYASVKKIQTMRQCACRDGRVRGGLLYYGAHTGRSAGRLIQPQNYRRPNKQSHEVYKILCDTEATLADLEELGSPFELAGGAIRHFIHSPGETMLQYDYASVEARIVLWLADEQEALDEFRQGVPVYSRMAAKVYGGDEDEIEEEDGLRRFVGKQLVLGAGFQLGAGGFITSCKKFGIDIDAELAQKAIDIFRAERPKLKKMWYQANSAMITSICHPGKVIPIGKHLKCFTVKFEGWQSTFLKLPSGRVISYPNARVSKSTKFDNCDEVQYWGPMRYSVHWGWNSAYGGVFIENATQGVAADQMTVGALEARNNKLLPFMLVHDEALAKGGKKKAELFAKCLTTKKPWARGLPLSVSGKVTPYYDKG